MKIINIDLNGKKSFYKLSESFVKSFEGKTLLFSLIQESRELEKELDMADYIIYDNQDYINNTASLEKIALELDENIEMIPSSYKLKNNELDYNRLEEDVKKLDYDNVIAIFDNNLDVKNKPKLIKLVEASDESSENVIVLDDDITSTKHKGIFGLLNNDEEKRGQLISNLNEDKYLTLEEKKGFFAFLRNLFK